MKLSSGTTVGAGMALALLLVWGCASGCSSVGGRTSIGNPLERIARAEGESPALPRVEGPITVQTAVERALALDPAVTAQTLTVRAAHHAVRAARGARDPELRLSYGQGDADSVRDSRGTELRSDLGGFSASDAGFVTATDDREGYSVALRVFPRNPWARSAAVSRARARLSAELATLEALRQTTEIAVRRAYGDLHFAQTDLALVDRLVDLRRQLGEEVKALTDRGQTTVMDSAAVSARYMQSLADRARRRRDLASAHIALSRLAGIPPGELSIAWEDGTFGRSDPAALHTDDILPLALENRADLAALGWRRLEADAACREAKAQHVPWLTHVQGSYGVRNTDGRSTGSSSEYNQVNGRTTWMEEYSVESEDQEEWQISAGVTLPVFSWMSGEVDVLRAERERAAAAERQAIAALRQDLEIAIGRLRALYDDEAAFSLDADPVLADMGRLLDSTNAASRLSPQDESQLREQLLEAERTRLQTEYERAVAQLELEALLGLSTSPHP